MKKIIHLILLVFALPVCVKAQEPEASVEETADFSILPIIEQDEFYNKDEELGKIKEITRPECASQDLFEKAEKIIRDYLLNKNSQSTLAKREQRLTLSNLHGFEEIPTADFTDETDINTADALITLKINNKIPQEDFILCRQKNALTKPLYILFYPYSDNYKGLIINLAKNSKNFEEITFIYP